MLERWPAMRRGWVLVAVAAVVLAATAAVYVNRSGNGKPGQAALARCAGALAAARRIDPLAVGEVAAFRVADAPDPLDDLKFAADGRTVTLADFAGKTVLLNLWATWCVPCRAEMPALDRLQGALNVDVRDPARARRFLADIGVHRLTFYADPTLQILDRLRSRGLALGLPTTVLVDGKGCRVGVMEGPAAWDSDQAKALVGAAIG